MGDESDTVIKLSKRRSRRFHIMPFHLSKWDLYFSRGKPMYSSHQQRAASATSTYEYIYSPSNVMLFTTTCFLCI